MKYSLALALTIIFMSTSCGDENVPSCIEGRIADFKKTNVDRGATGIYTFEQDGQTYYIFDNGIAFDAIAEVLNSDCEVVCTYGGFRLVNDVDQRCETYQDGINRAVTEWEGGQ